MDKKSVTETAADAAKVAIGIAAMAMDALSGADRAEEANRNGNGDTAAAGASSSGTTGTQAQGSSGDININKAKFDELVALKHIGRGRAKRIMASRPFRSVEDLASQGIVPADTLAELRDRLTV